MQILWVILLQLAGTIAIIAEIMVPSFGLLTAGAVGAFGFSYYQLYLYEPAAIPFLVIINLFTVPITLYLAVKGVAKTKLSLNNALDQKEGKEPVCVVGDAGETFTDLRPAGKMVLGEKLIDVLSTGDFVEKGTLVEVVKIDNSGIKVAVKQHGIES